MKRDNIIKILLISFSTLVLLSILGYAYAYFSLQIEGTPKDVIVSTGALRLEYKDETELKLDGAFPGDSVSKVVTVKNVGTENVAYSLYWRELINTIENFELHVTLNCKSYINYGESNQTESGTCDNIYRAVPISNTTTTGNIKGNISIEPGITQEYTVTVKFDNKNYPQNGNMNRTFTGKIGIEEYTDPAVTNCTFDGEMVQGAKYVNGQYTYRYMQEGVYSNDSSLAWVDIKDKGWGVQLTDKDSTAVAIGNVCTYINNEPVISMSYMYSDSAAESINLSSFNTSKVKNMKAMFYKVTTTTLDTSSFDTSSVTDMSYMFYSQATKIDASGFDTSNVTDMSYMFSYTQATTLDLSSFNTSKVNNMNSMFSSTNATTIDVSGFDTSNVINMSNMFSGSNVVTLDLNNFDTSNVTDMSNMFSDAEATTLNVSNFNTNKVNNMNSMFSSTNATTLDLSNFDTSKVTNMGSMFFGSKVNNLDLSNFDTSNVTDMSNMFWFSSASVIDVSGFDTSKVTNMDYMFYDSKAKTIYVSDKFVTNKITVANSANMFTGATNLVGGNGTKYNSSHVDKTYARIDTASTPGYFTSK
jgi:surface protein